MPQFSACTVLVKWIRPEVNGADCILTLLHHVIYIGHALQIRPHYFRREAPGVRGGGYDAAVPQEALKLERTVAAAMKEVDGERVAQLMQVKLHLGFSAEHVYEISQAFGPEGRILVPGHPKKWRGVENWGAGTFVEIFG